ncbi:hypothetical protein MBLNU459_g0669t1 [Dothideomycetes sp. NU459]
MSDPVPIDIHLEVLGYHITFQRFAVGIVTLVVGGIFFLIFWANYVDTDERRAKKAPKRDPNLPAASEVVSLRIYPIKSCRGIEVTESRLKKTGLDLDRNWMFVDAKTREFLTIRSDPSMTLIDTGLSRPNVANAKWDQLHVSINGTEDHISIPCYPTKEWLEENTKLTTVEIWGAKTDAWEYGADINAMFSRYFSKEVALVFKGPQPRISGGNGDPSLYGKEVPHHFADVMSLQVASEASLRDLNERLRENGQDELTIERFRPNIVIKGGEPWEEDRWKRIRINTIDHNREMLWRVELDVLARCARCQVPNVNPETAEKHAHEPWDTLMKFRRVDQGGVAKYKPCFGMLCLPRSESDIKVGSTVEVLEVTEKHLYNTAKFQEL